MGENINYNEHAPDENFVEFEGSEKTLLPEMSSRALSQAMAGIMAHTMDRAVSEINKNTEEALYNFASDLEEKLSLQWREVYHEFIMATEARFADMQLELKATRILLDERNNKRWYSAWWKRWFPAKTKATAD